MEIDPYQFLVNICHSRISQNNFYLYLPEGIEQNQYLVRNNLDAARAWPTTSISEIALLSSYFNQALVHSDGTHFSVECVTTNSSDPRLPPLPVLLEIGTTCQRYCGELEPGGRRSPVSIHIVIIGAAPLSPETSAALRHYCIRSANLRVSWLYIDMHSGRIRSSGRGIESWERRRYFRRAWRHRNEARDDSALESANFDRFQIATSVIAILLMLTFSNTIYFAGMDALLSVPIEILFWAGGILSDALQRGQVYRLVSALFVHNDIFHVTTNVAVLLYAGSYLERIVGRYWLITIYGITGIIGECCSVLYHPGAIIYGASPAVAGIIGALLPLANRVLVLRERQKLQRTIAVLILLLLIPARDGEIFSDVIAHVAGLISGLIIGTVINRAWRKDSARIPAQSSVEIFAGALAILIFLSLGISFAQLRFAIAAVR